MVGSEERALPQPAQRTPWVPSTLTVDGLGRRPGDIGQQPTGYQRFREKRSRPPREPRRRFRSRSGDGQTVIGTGAAALPARHRNGRPGRQACGQPTPPHRQKSSRTRRNFKSVRPTFVVTTSITSLRSTASTSTNQRIPRVTPSVVANWSDDRTGVSNHHRRAFGANLKAIRSRSAQRPEGHSIGSGSSLCPQQPAFRR